VLSDKNEYNIVIILNIARTYTDKHYILYINPLDRQKSSVTKIKQIPVHATELFGILGLISMDGAAGTYGPIKYITIRLSVCGGEGCAKYLPRV